MYHGSRIESEPASGPVSCLCAAPDDLDRDSHLDLELDSLLNLSLPVDYDLDLDLDQDNQIAMSRIRYGSESWLAPGRGCICISG